jgi:hypothetical protein
MKSSSVFRVTQWIPFAGVWARDEERPWTAIGLFRQSEGTGGVGNPENVDQHTQIGEKNQNIQTGTDATRIRHPDQYQRLDGRSPRLDYPRIKAYLSLIVIQRKYPEECFVHRGGT